MNITIYNCQLGFSTSPAFWPGQKDLARPLHSNDFLLLCAGGSAMSPFCCVKPLPWSWDGENGENPQEIWGSSVLPTKIGKISFFVGQNLPTKTDNLRYPAYVVMFVTFAVNIRSDSAQKIQQIEVQETTTIQNFRRLDGYIHLPLSSRMSAGNT